MIFQVTIPSVYDTLAQVKFLPVNSMSGKTPLTNFLVFTIHIFYTARRNESDFEFQYYFAENTDLFSGQFA